MNGLCHCINNLYSPSRQKQTDKRVRNYKTKHKTEDTEDVYNMHCVLDVEL